MTCLLSKLEDRDAEMRVAAVDAVGSLALTMRDADDSSAALLLAKQSLPHLIKRLHDWNPAVRILALRSFSSLATLQRVSQ